MVLVIKSVLFIVAILNFISNTSGLDEVPGYQNTTPQNGVYLPRYSIRACEGSPHPEGSFFHSPIVSYRYIQTMYMNCTHIIGSVVLANLENDVDISFLNSIVEIGGSLIILNMKNMSRISLQNLTIIRGHVPYVHEGAKLSLYIAHNKATAGRPGVINLGSLTSVLNHGIKVLDNKGYCHLANVDWKVLPETKTQSVTFLPPKESCPVAVKCSSSCPIVKGRRFCFGGDSDTCQRVSQCSRSCNSRRCFWDEKKKTDDCCHDECAGGCRQDTLSTSCFACRNFRLDNKCVKSCPPRMIYSISDYRKIPNKDFRFSLGNLCVKKCSKHYLEDGSSCVKQCTPGVTIASGMKCIPCTPKVCATACHHSKLEEKLVEKIKKLGIEKKYAKIYDFGTKVFHFTPRSVLQELKNCNSYDGPISINLFSANENAANEHIRNEDLENLKNIRSINGRLTLMFSKDLMPANLSFLSNLESISDSSSFGLMIFGSGRSSIRYLGLNKLKTLNVKSIQIARMPNLCFMENFKARLDPTVKFVMVGSKSPESCSKEGFVCDKNCVPSKGCWGPGPLMCVECSNKTASGKCVPRCTDVAGFYEIPGNLTCGKCHPQCKKTCRGPKADQCIGGCKVAQNGTMCVAQCSLLQYLDNKGFCRECSRACFAMSRQSKAGVNLMNPVCLGPEPRRSPQGCTHCDIVMLDANNRQEKCVSVCPKIGRFSAWLTKDQIRRNPGQLTMKDHDSRTVACVPCHPACEICDGFHDVSCTKCKKEFYKIGDMTCKPDCVGNYYKNETGERSCRPCHTTCRNGCSGPFSKDCFSCQYYRNYLDDKKKSWVCTSVCPPGKNFTENDFDSDDKICVAALSSRKDKRLLIGLTIGLLVIVLIIVTIITYVCVQRRRAKLLRDRDLMRAHYTRQIKDDLPILNSTDYQPNAGQLRMIGNKNLIKGVEIGSGAFGTVFKGIWKPPKEKDGDVDISIDVAIKELKESGNLTSTKEFLEEAHVMASVDHHFCVQLLGVCMSSHMQLITEFMPLGCLKDYLPKHAKDLGSQQLMTWVVQIAKGMTYLESRGIVHRDLAARNVLLQNVDQVRITDFGLAKLLDPSGDEFQSISGRFPVRWLALESLSERVFSSKSDVWSFGVTCWEVFTFGNQRPYQEVTAPGLFDFLVTGERLQQPEICTLDIYMLMIKCWLVDPDSRPTFSELVEELSKMASDPGRYLIIKHDKLRHHLPNQSSSCETSTSPRLSGILPPDKPKQPNTVALPDEGLPYLAAELAGRTADPRDSTPEHYSEDPLQRGPGLPSSPAPPVPLARVDEAVDVETGEFDVEDDYLLPDADDYVAPSEKSPLQPQRPGLNNDHDYINQPLLRDRAVHNPNYKSQVEPVMDDDYLTPDPQNDTRESNYSDMDCGGYLDPLITNSRSPNPRA